MFIIRTTNSVQNILTSPQKNTFEQQWMTLFVSVFPSLTWGIYMHFPPLGIIAAHQCIIYNLASTASYPIAVMEAPTTAELTAFCGVRNPPTAAVTHPHRDPALRGVRAAVLIYKDKDRWRKPLNDMEKIRLKSSRKEQIPFMYEVFWHSLFFTWT